MWRILILGTCCEWGLRKTALQGNICESHGQRRGYVKIILDGFYLREGHEYSGKIAL